MYDRALQGVFKTVLEPEWEAYFEPNSYGFRPGRRCQDAITQIKNCLQHKAKYVLDADIAKCFDKINHDALLRKLNTRGTVRRQIKAWLTSGVIDMGAFVETNEGTPQGGVISPLLANIALHGMEEMIKQRFPARKSGVILKSVKKYGVETPQPNMVRYADDFVVMSDNLTVIQECKQYISEWLSNIGLELKPSKTRLTHTLNPELSEDGKAGFDFLGFHVQQHPCSTKEGNEDTKGRRLGWKLLITPTKEKLIQHQKSLAQAIMKVKDGRKPQKGEQKGKLNKQARLIHTLNPIITGWMNYHKHSDIKTVGGTAKQDHLMYIKLRAWARRQCGTTAKGHKKYWTKVGKRNGIFATKDETGKPAYILKTHSETTCSCTSYIKVKGTASPFDGKLVYWSTRMGEYHGLNPRVAALLKRQRGKCAHCGFVFQETDVLEVDHIIPIAGGGKDQWDNLQLLHGHCHDSKTTTDAPLIQAHKDVKAAKASAKTSKRQKGNYRFPNLNALNEVSDEPVEEFYLVDEDAAP